VELACREGEGEVPGQRCRVQGRDRRVADDGRPGGAKGGDERGEGGEAPPPDVYRIAAPGVADLQRRYQVTSATPTRWLASRARVKRRSESRLR
jgi:hypothetical protein